MVEDIKNLDAELHVEILGDSLDAIIFENREIQTCDAGANQSVAADIPAKIKTGQIRDPRKIYRVWKFSAQTWRRGAAVGCPECAIWSQRKSETLCLDI